MIDIREKREKVLAKLYDTLLESDLDEFKPTASTGFGSDAKRAQQNPMIQLIATLEDANAREADRDIKNEELAFDNAHHEIDNDQRKIEEAVKLCATGVTLVTSLVWAVIFVHEMNATRVFEVDGTPTSAADKWGRMLFPKFRAM